MIFDMLFGFDMSQDPSTGYVFLQGLQWSPGERSLHKAKLYVFSKLQYNSDYGIGKLERCHVCFNVS